MSNAAVVKLTKKLIAGDSIWMDDNFGESVHLHINDFRVDMSRVEFDALYNDTIKSINALIDVKDFDAADYDSVFLEQNLFKHLMYLTELKKDEVFLEDLFAGGRYVKPLKKSRIFKALSGDVKSGKKKRGSDHMGQDSADRIKDIDKSILLSDYDTSKGYIILFGNDNIIRDGQHRACSLLKKHGNIKVPVMRMYFSNYRDFNAPLRAALRMPSYRLKDGIVKFSENGFFSVTGLKKLAIAFIKKLLSLKKLISGKAYIILHKKQYKKNLKILSGK